MKALISLAILISFLFSNSSCEGCYGQEADKKEDCKAFTVESGQFCCFLTREDEEEETKTIVHNCYFLTQDEIDNKEKTMSDFSKEGYNMLDFDCDLSSSGGNTENKEND